MTYDRSAAMKARWAAQRSAAAGAGQQPAAAPAPTAADFARAQRTALLSSGPGIEMMRILRERNRGPRTAAQANSFLLYPLTAVVPVLRTEPAFRSRKPESSSTTK